MADGKSLTREEFDEVIRRATELSLDDSGGEESRLDESDLLRIAREVGLSETHVRRALAEMRSQQLAPRDESGFFDAPAVQASRMVPGDAKEIATTLDDFLLGRCRLRPVRSRPSLRTYRPRNEWTAELMRSLEQSKHYISSAKGVEVQLEPVSETSTEVRIAVDSGLRGDYVLLAWIAGLGIGAGLSAGGIGLAFALGLPVLVGGGSAILVGAVAGWASMLGVRGAWRRKRRDIHQEIEGILDNLEAGDPLGPPPPKWRRWIDGQLKELGLTTNSD